MDSPTAIQNRLKKRFGIHKTGGKGTVRRKKKVVKVRLSDTLISKDEQAHNKFINDINANLNIGSDHIEIVNNFINEWCFDSVDNLRKKDLNKTLKNKVDIGTLRETYDSWFVNNILDMGGGSTTLKTNYKFYNTTFSEQGYRYLKNSIRDLEKDIKEKKYIFNKKDDDDKEINATELLNKLELDITNIPTKQELKKAYFKMSGKYHPDKNQDNVEECSRMFKDLNDAYKKLLFYYHNETNKHLYV